MKHIIKTTAALGAAGVILLGALFLIPVPPRADAAPINDRLSGRIVLQIEEHGEAWYVWPEDKHRFFLGRPDDAFAVMRTLGLGISNNDLYRLFGLSIGTGVATLPERDRDLFTRLAGRIVLQVEAHGEAFYLDPVTRNGYFLGRPADAFRIMRERGLGITNADLETIPLNGIAHTTQTSPSSPMSMDEVLQSRTEGYAALRQYALDDINRIRHEHGKPALVMNALLNTIAEAHSRDMAENIGAMSHDGSLNETAADRIKRGRVRDATTGQLTTIPHPDNIGWSGENVGMRSTMIDGNAGYERAIRDLHLWFLNEPEDEPNHRTTMLSTLYPFTNIGIGIYLERGVLWITEDYISVLPQ